MKSLYEDVRRVTRYAFIATLVGLGFYGCYLAPAIAGGFAVLCLAAWSLGAGWR